jgi:hypothetical protein
LFNVVGRMAGSERTFQSDFRTQNSFYSEKEREEKGDTSNHLLPLPHGICNLADLLKLTVVSGRVKD